jgi:hypothetical protein
LARQRIQEARLGLCGWPLRLQIHHCPAGIEPADDLRLPDLACLGSGIGHPDCDGSCESAVAHAVQSSGADRVHSHGSIRNRRLDDRCAARLNDLERGANPLSKRLLDARRCLLRPKGKNAGRRA